ncbi:hypothetical protein GA0115252_150921 [Streptomyces sp. DfronAA-171]|nr:hypothetical protein GA0115252_150921 [Streptomyces sp. DfronAA-171]
MGGLFVVRGAGEAGTERDEPLRAGARARRPPRRGPPYDRCHQVNPGWTAMHAPLSSPLSTAADSGAFFGCFSAG